MRTLGSGAGRSGRARAMALVAVATMAGAGAALAGVSVQEQVEPGPIGRGDPFQLTVSVVGAERSVGVQLPAGDFQVLGKSHATQLQMSSGTSGMETTRTEQFTFTLAATRAGHLVIPGAQVNADGSSLAAEPVQVEVQPGHVARAQAQDADDDDPLAAMMQRMRGPGMGGPQSGGISAAMRRMMGSDPFAGDPFNSDPFAGQAVEVKPGDVRLEAVADRRSARPGEQITISYYLTTRVPVSSVNDLEIPAYDGAATRTIELGKQLVPEVADGVARVLIARRAIFANAAGALQIQSATAKLAAGDPFSPQELTVTSAPLTLSIQPLPPGPENPAVGRWSLALSGPASARAGEPLTLKITAQGLGDTSSLPQPALALPAGWKAFPASTTETQAMSGGRVGGTRTWEQVVIPSGSGPVQLGPVSLQEFEPQAGRYVEVKSAALPLSIAAAAPVEANGADVPAARAGTERARLAQLQLPRVSSSLLAWLALAAVAGLLALLGIRFSPRRGSSDGDPANGRSVSLREAARLLDEARALCSSERAPDFFAALTRALDTLAAALGAPEAATAELAAIASALKARGLATPACESISRALEACRRFAFLRSRDASVLRRTLLLADDAFEAAGA